MKGSHMSGPSIFDNMVATAGPTVIGSQQAPNLTSSQLNHMANQMFNQAYSQHMAQQSLAGQQYNQALAQQRHEWMINGRTMTFNDFLDEICPDQDDPHRTYLTLKYKGIK